MTMKPVSNYWAAAIFSGFASPVDWRSWADREIEHSDCPDHWIIALSLASSEDELLKPLGEQMENEERILGHRIYIGNAKLGFTYWSFKLGKLSFADFLTVAGNEADGGTGDLECESIYSILNRLEDREKSGKQWDDLVFEADRLFLPYWAEAKEQWKLLGMEEPRVA
jgi:hypothetical protein